MRPIKAWPPCQEATPTCQSNHAPLEMEASDWYFFHRVQTDLLNGKEENKEILSETSQTFLENSLPSQLEFEEEYLSDGEILSETSQTFLENSLPSQLEFEEEYLSDGEILSETSQTFLENSLPSQLEFEEEYLSDGEILSETSQTFLENSLPSQLEFEEEYLSDGEILSETSQTFLEFPLPSQIGFGAANLHEDEDPNEAGPSGVSDAFHIRGKSRKSKNKKFRAEEFIFEVKIDQQRAPAASLTPFNILTQQIRSLFEAILQRSTMNLVGHDIRFCLFSDRLDKLISTCQMRVDEMTVDILLATISKVLQSKTEIPLDKCFHLDIITVKRPSPGSGRRRVTNLQLDCLNKKSIYQLEEDGSGLCCARAISYAMAIKNADPQLRNIRRKGSDVLRKRAEDLHRAAGVPLVWRK
ncbi:hypothetical protein JTE90_016150 [Oedothorax gibbosus]|uniref:Uncharacterized protein n=1 Tax=Oedothorax gibbosus TaxID=931172 RepID=A0AAV6TN73_9ARAC|nr:hypothetical protein JTE90_016150 [Oedothorax gibbosus]